MATPLQNEILQKVANARAAGASEADINNILSSQGLQNLANPSLLMGGFPPRPIPATPTNIANQALLAAAPVPARGTGGRTGRVERLREQPEQVGLIPLGDPNQALQAISPRGSTALRTDVPFAEEDVFVQDVPDAEREALARQAQAQLGVAQENIEAVNAAQAQRKLQEGTGTTEDAIVAAKATEEDAKAKGVDVKTLTPTKPENVEKGFWDSLTSQFDLTTVGLTLLATNGNGKSLSENLGFALMAGRDRITQEAATKEAKIDKKLDRAKKIAEIRKLTAEAQKKLTGDGLELKDIRPTTQDVATSEGILATVLDSKPDSKIVQTLAGDFALERNKILALAAREGRTLTPQQVNKAALAGVSGKTKNETLSSRLETLEDGFFSSALEEYNALLGL